MPRLPGRSDPTGPGVFNPLPGAELRPYQRAGVQFLEAGPRRFLADEPGLGKSAQLIQASRGDTLVIAPATILYGGTWDDELARWADNPDRFTQAPYSSLCERESTGNKSGSRPVQRLRPEFDRDWGTLILDEAHYVKNRGTTWTWATKAIAKRSDRVFLATGTPIPNWPHELFVLLQLLRPEDAKTGKDLGSFWRWANRWFITMPDPHTAHGQIVRGLKGCAAFDCYLTPADGPPCEHYREFVAENFGELYLQRLRDDVLTDLPPLTGPVRVEVRMTREQTRVYRELRDAFVSEVEGDELVAWSTGAKHVMMDRACTGLGLVSPDLGERESGKLARLRLDLESRARPTLVVAHYRDSVEAAARVARSLGLRVGVVHGAITPKQRGEAVRDFQHGRSDVLVGSLDTVAEGLTLTRADMVIFLEQSYKPSRNQQAIRRIHRLGQQHPCVALDYVAVTDRGGKTVDGGKRELLAEKTDLQMRVLTAAQLRRVV